MVDHWGEQLVESSPLAILTLNNKGEILSANRSAHQLFGFDDHLAEGVDARTFLPILDQFLNVPAATGALRTLVRAIGRRRDGERFLAQLWVSTYQTRAGPELAAVIWDASEDFRASEELWLDNLMTSSRLLVAALSREIRTLASSAAMARDGFTATAGTEAAEYVTALGMIIDDFDTMAASGLAISTGGGASIADLDAVLEDARIVIEPSIREIGGSTNWQIATGLPPILSDHHRLIQVFLSLARNSERAIKDARQKQISVVAALDRDRVVVRFSDTGAGVANPEKLFQPLYRRGLSGGLSLYLSKIFLCSTGGYLRYQPTYKGACFVVELCPVAEAKSAS